MAYNSMFDTMYEYCREYAFSYGSMGGLSLNSILILIIAVLVVALFNRSNFTRSSDTDRLTRVEKDVEYTKRIIEDVKNKLDEI